MRFFVALSISCFVLSVHAETLAAPEGPIVLTVDGNITIHSAGSDTAAFDIDMLRALPATTIRTRTPWTEGVTEFTGVRISDLLEAVGAGSMQFVARALDDYWFDVTDIDFKRYPAVIAYERDGQPMSRRDLGPLWVMLPFDDFPELATDNNRNACVWQLNRISVH